MVKLSILIPVRDEGVNLRILLKILQATVEVPHEILVVHDEARDDSIPVVQEFMKSNPQVRLVHNQLGRGVANAIRAGADVSRGEYVLIFAADEVGPVLAIDNMLRLMDSSCDLVSCTRYAHGGRRLGGSLIGGILSRIANGLFHRLGMALTDATTGIKMFRRPILERFALEASPRGWAVAFELAIKAQVAGLRLGEVPIISIDRLYGGTSTFALGQWVPEYLRWFLWGLKEIRRSGRSQAKALTIEAINENARRAG